MQRAGPGPADLSTVRAGPSQAGPGFEPLAVYCISFINILYSFNKESIFNSKYLTTMNLFTISTAYTTQSSPRSVLLWNRFYNSATASNRITLLTDDLWL